MRTMKQWQELFLEFEQSGVRQKDFCLSKGISVKTFSARKSQMKSIKIGKARKTRAHFIKVEKQVPSLVRLSVPGLNLRIKTKSGVEIEFPVSALASVISALNGDSL